MYCDRGTDDEGSCQEIPRHGQNKEDGGGDAHGDGGRGGDEEAVTTPQPATLHVVRAAPQTCVCVFLVFGG